MAYYQHLALKDHVRETQIFTQRLIIATIIVIILTTLLLARLSYLQIINLSHYSLLSENNRVNILPIPPTRGLIYDHNGILLAQNLPSFTLELVSEHIDDVDATVAQIGKLISLSEEDIKRFNKNRRHKRRFEGIPLRFRLNDEEVARIAVNQYRMPGVNIHANLTRHYPLGALGTHAIGYVGRINIEELRTLDESDYSGTNHIGKTGIELAYEDQLHGSVGLQKVETNAQGKILRVLERQLPIPGKNLYLNLDVKLQAIAEKGFGENTGALVAIDPRDGAVLALASVPTYDPNLFVNGISTHDYSQLRDSPDRPLFNRALRGQYPPGSTIKPFIGLTGLEVHEINLAEEINCPGWYMLKNDPRRYRDWKKTGHGKVDLTRAIVESCDVYFYDLSLALGIDNMHDFLARFGLGQRTGIDIEGEKAGLLPSRGWKRRTRNLPWFPGETLITGIGQGFMLTTPLQLASITASLSLHGQRKQPRMIYAIEAPDNSRFDIIPPVSINPPVAADEANWNIIIQAMKKVVHSLHGTARRINRKLPYTIAGKTGTAQVFGIKQDEEYIEEEVAKKLRDHALFIGFAPVDDPQIAIAVIVENAGSGGAMAAPIARKVMDQYLLSSGS
ncbi:Peptidoglycan D,D-transpeptidase MrdA [hydrothermal vent metagenome]|uniref:Peptidoglycan D,D-transpeptidase MrdA n=1 Tax=hydrothermal vent metagenome TaxID=652676 RepID=A0A3B1BQV8_9ZZZZ